MVLDVQSSTLLQFVCQELRIKPLICWSFLCRDIVAKSGQSHWKSQYQYKGVFDKSASPKGRLIWKVGLVQENSSIFSSVVVPHKTIYYCFRCSWKGNPCDISNDFETKLTNLGLCHIFNGKSPTEIVQEPGTTASFAKKKKTYLLFWLYNVCFVVLLHYFRVTQCTQHVVECWKGGTHFGVSNWFWSQGMFKHNCKKFCAAFQNWHAKLDWPTTFSDLSSRAIKHGQCWQWRVCCGSRKTYPGCSYASWGKWTFFSICILQKTFEVRYIWF